VLGDGAELRHAARLAELDIAVAARLANALADADVLAHTERLAFVQPIVRRAIYAERLAADRAEAHLRAAELLYEESTLPERVAGHLLHARRSGSAWVVDALRSAAGQALARGAPGIAARYLRRALDEPPDSELRAQVVLELGRAEATAGEPGAVDRLSQASELTEDPRQRARTALDAGRTLHAQGRQEDAATAFERGFEEVREVDADLAGRLRASGRAVARLSVFGTPQELDAVPTAGGEDSHLDRLACAEGAFAKALAGSPRKEVLDLATRALANGALLDAETADGPGYYLAAASFTVAEDVQTAEAALTAAVEDARSRGSVLGYATASSFRAGAILARGRVDHAAADAQTALAGARYGWRLALPDAHAVVAEARIERGDLDGAARELDLAGRRLRDPDGARRHVFLATRGHLRLLRGQPAEALVDYVECGRRLEEGGVLNPAVLPWRSGAAVACAALGHTDDARHYAERELELAKRFGAPGPVGRALSTLGSVIGGDRGLEALREAVEVLRGSQAVLLRARALVDYGAALRRAGKRKASREPLREGLDLAERLGARALARRAQEEVRAAGGRPRRTALQGVESLTPREHQVADLAAQGKSNREIAKALFVTQKTVEWHLRNGYEKLGVASRSELWPALSGKTEKG
jgi:DNA-binding CsgD family transcriptional regulator